MAEKNGYRRIGVDALTAKKEDRARMEAAKAVHDQLNSKTVGPPLPATGLVGDLEPESTVTVGDFDTVRNQFYLQIENELAMSTLNAIGQLTNMQSQSGPIPGTSQIVGVGSITNSLVTVFKPDAGEVWQLYAAGILTLDGASTMILKLQDGTNQVVVDSGNSTSGEMELNEPIFVTSTVWLEVRTSDASSGSAQMTAAFIRVR